MIKGIFFDASGVLYQRPTSTRRYVQQLLQEEGLVRTPSPTEETHLATSKEQAINGWIEAQVYWDRYLQVYGMDDPLLRGATVTQILEYVNRVQAVPGAYETLKALHDRGFILGVIASTMYPVRWKMNWLAAAGVGELITVVACSTAIGLMKPHPSVYWYAINKARLMPRQAAFVANGVAELGGAKEAGMTTVAVLYETGAQADYYAETLPELVDVPVFQL